MMQFIKDQDPKNQINISPLPQEILLHLQIIDLIPLRLVCKLWDELILKIMELKSREYTKYEPGYLINFGPEYPWYQQIKLKKLIDSGNEQDLEKALSHPHAVISRDLFFYSEAKKGQSQIIRKRANTADIIQSAMSSAYLRLSALSDLRRKLCLFNSEDDPKLAYSLLHTILFKNITNKDHLLNILMQSRISLKILPNHYQNIIKNILYREKPIKLADSYNAMFILRFMNHIIKLDQPILNKFLSDIIYGDKLRVVFIDFLVKLGANIDYDYKDSSLLYKAIENDNYEFVKKILSLGANPNKNKMFNGKCYYPLYYAVMHCRNYKMADILMQHGATVLDIQRKFMILEFEALHDIKIDIRELEEKYQRLCAKPEILNDNDKQKSLCIIL